MASEGPDPIAWRGRWASAAALVAAIVLVALLGLVTTSRTNRDAALELERNTYEAIQLTRAVDATIARAEAAMGRFVLDPDDSGPRTEYYQQWRLAGRQIGQLRNLARDPDQQRRIDELRGLFDRRGEELATAASASVREGLSGVGLFYRAAQSENLQQLSRKLDEIVRAGRQNLEQRLAGTQADAEWTDRLTRWLGWLALLISALAIALSYWAYRAFAEGRLERTRAENEAGRAYELEIAVEERTRELSEAYQSLQAESVERAAAEEKLRQVQKMEAVGSLTGGIAHDFNNMLAVVVGGLDLARRKLQVNQNEAADQIRAAMEKSTLAATQHIESAMEGANRAAALTRRLLAFARAEPLMPEAITPSALVEGMRELIDRTIGERIQVETAAPDDAWQVWADPTGLENAILNLCVNARDAMPEGGVIRIVVDNVTLGRGEVDALEPGDHVRIAVTDTGEGIAPEHLDRVFEPFFTTKPVGKGTGLGLSQIFGFARQSDGEVTIRSEVGRGTAVTIYLPRARPDAERSNGGQAAALEPATIVPIGKARILVVEDDPRVSRSTVSALDELGHEAVAVASGQQALDHLATDSRFDLIITDVVMPGMTGIELAQRIGIDHPAMRVLFVTGYVGEAGTFDDFAGADLLRKPFTVEQLANAVARALPYGVAAE